MIIYLCGDNIKSKKRIIDFKSILLINSFPFILLSCNIIRQGFSSLGVCLFIILLNQKYNYKNKLLKILYFILALFISSFHLLGIVSIFFIWSYKIFIKLKSEKISLIIINLFSLKVKKSLFKELLNILFFLPIFLISSLSLGVSERFSNRVFTGSQIYDSELLGLFFLLVLPILILLKERKYIDNKLKILYFLNISNIFLLLISTKAFGRMAISTIFYNLIFLLYSKYKLRINKIDFGFFYLIMCSVLTLLKLKYFKFLIFYF